MIVCLYKAHILSCQQNTYIQICSLVVLEHSCKLSFAVLTWGS